uniref:NADH-ubiquinone oxidoreductase chain 4L n=1 Tax=Liphistius erawan TaxID=1155480 RepID=L7NWP0_LIPER|nr:NADH dehydrogenase subunit 4L [Liphistius erawan]AFC77878.1 NADH dehydrogenase subunit 4L [Liphistius erawan]
MLMMDFGFLVGVVSLLWWRYHILCCLLSIELMLSMVFLSLVYASCLEFNESSVLLVFLSMVVCESSVGLSLLVSLSRSHGGDSISFIWSLN